MSKAIFIPLKLSLGTVICFSASPLLAQVTTDGTVNTQVNQNGSISEITGGETRGNNLFHSFQDFSVPTGNEAFFDNASDIANIFSRVTGGNISNINGLIRANDSASLFLINPNGIIFGENARLDIGGSFYGSSASSILFEDGEFSAADLDNPPLLTVNAPIGLGFRDNPGDITNRSQLNSGSDVALIGGDINFDAGQVNAPNIQLGGLADAGIVDFNPNNGFNFPNTVDKANISLVNGSFLGISGTIGGFISASANNITHSDASNITVGVENGVNLKADSNILFDRSLIINQVSSAQPGDAADINLVAAGNITFDNNSLILNQVQPNATGNAGNINAKANSLDLRNESLWIADTSGNGNSGNIGIDVANQMTINQGSIILTGVQPGGKGEAGDININTGSLISNNSLILADSDDMGGAGNININADNDIILQGFPRGTDEVADALRDRPSQVITGLNTIINEETDVIESAGQGNGGNINISAKRLILKDRAFIISNIEESSIGDGGIIDLDINLLRLENNAFISTFTESEFKAGSINVNSQNLELVSGGKLITSTDGTGNAGTINLDISNNIIIDNGQLPTVPRVVFDDAILTELQGQSGLFANATERATGNGGSISIGQDSNSFSTNIRISNSGEIRADGGVSGNAGNIFLSANSLFLDSETAISANTLSDRGANINILLSENLTLNNDSSISAQAFDAGNGGNINIDSRFLIAFPDGNNDILASAEQGQGGNITINAESLLGIQEGSLNPQTNDINASSRFSLDGTVSISAPDINPVRGATELPTNVVEQQETTQQACNNNREVAAKNGLNITGKGGITPDPKLPLNSLNVAGNNDSNYTSNIPAPIKTSIGKIQPARGIRVTESGTVVLTAYRTNNAGERLPEHSVNCDRRR